MDDKDQPGRDQPQGKEIAEARAVNNPATGQIATERQLQEAEQNIEKRMSAFERSMIRLTWAAVIISILSAAVFAGQLYEMVTGATATDKLIEYAKVQANAGSDQADAAQQFSDTAEDINSGIGGAVDQLEAAAKNTSAAVKNAQSAFREEQRAWVGVQGTADSGGFTETEPWKIKVVFFNSGKTPARSVQTSGMFITSPIPITGPFAEQVKRLTFHPGQSIAPQGYYRQTIGADTQAESYTKPQMEGKQTLVSQYKLIKEKQLFLYYFGILKYLDNSGRHRETQFCIYLADPVTKESGICDAFNNLN